ncbi:TPA: amino acid adenylation domain-containing protein [Klebsiella pneumoniae]|uniref:non-ribosomal peptide synthetase/type I polyketide synthase n=1 Tax=Klebsiella pneumoniae TaxID=573 RepID=UPI0020CED7B5|nr:non-ribosomal peptide synthetase/type I polyketide synthase [Klebsiella pneumoniae]MCQ0649276.1 amino acid adenylation domain-containing protein [Klebsiella pneumoniae]HBR0883715.1 amino acid adenylation domain-containing protein [Klebsiella pneumoniae]HBR6212499.1 amino acid adenylation domain-containing protein [Klebsiella pneumoniae]HDK6193396.1 amino acid adenylation domain-containing protein [Klebsiella pneumoniae]
MYELEKPLSNEYTGNELAVIGMAGRFPGAGDIDSYWKNLCQEIDSVTWHTDFTQQASTDGSWHVPAGYLLTDVDQFDAKFFGMSPKEAAITDPQQRLLLECAWEALENAGYAATCHQQNVGVYVSSGPSGYWLHNIANNKQLCAKTSKMQFLIGNDKDYAANRISYKLDLKGPSIVVQSACSSSLLAVHTAGQSLLAGECDMALAGGISLEFPAEEGYWYEPGSILSQDGHCKPFSENASGTVRGNGGGIVVLKRLDDAINDRDHIYAIIRGSATNNDGAQKVGYAAPSVEGQTRVIQMAHAVANVTPNTIGYVETHGTATSLGDPIEIAALAAAFGGDCPAESCNIGSVKSNIGHLDAGAGIAGFIKTSLSLYHGYIPATLHYRKPNPAINFADTPFTVTTTGTPWEGNGPRRAGVSSFGIGGSNVHVVMEQPPVYTITPTAEPATCALRLSAKNQVALSSIMHQLALYLRNHPEISLADVAHSLATGRKAFPVRAAILADTVEDAIAQLETERPKTLCSGEACDLPMKTAFMFPGQGTQYQGMGANLYHTGGIFTQEFNRLAHLFQPFIDYDLSSLLFNKSQDNGELLAQTWLSQPAIFAVEYALAKHWQASGLNPEGMIGHSIGEYVAACLAGVFTLEDAVRVVSARGRLMQSMDPGEMLAVMSDEASLHSRLPSTLSIAAVNRPALTVISGPAHDMDAFRRSLELEGISCRALQTSHAFHSAMMEPCLQAFGDVLAQVTLTPPRQRFISNLSGTWITDEEATDPDYWVRHLRGTVRFADGLATLIDKHAFLLFECGPGTSLSQAARAISAGRKDVNAIPLLSPEHATLNGLTSLLRIQEQRWCYGQVIPHSSHGNKIPLPTYRFDRARHWVDPEPQTASAASAICAVVNETTPEQAQPVNTLAEKLTLLWCEALGVAHIESNENFFDLGGDSILSIQIANRARTLGLHFGPGDILEFPTVESLLAALDSRTEQRDAQAQPEEDLSKIYANALEIRPDEAFLPFPLTDIQHAYWVGRNAGNNSGNVAAHAYEEFECADLNLARLEQALNTLIAQHDMLRAVITHDGMQRVLPQVPRYIININDFSQLKPKDAATRLADLRERKSHQMMPCEQWPLFDISASRLPDGTVRLHVSFDLLIMDAWSITLFWRELEERYYHTDYQPETVDITFRDYVLAEQRLEHSTAYQRARDYWLQRVDTFPSAPSLPQRIAPQNLEHRRFVRRETTIPNAVWRKLKDTAARQGLTPSTILLTAYTEILANWSETPHFCLNLPAFNRLEVHPQVDKVMGDFTSVLLFEADLREDETFLQRARNTQKRLWDDLSALQYNGVKMLRDIAEKSADRPTMPYVFTSLIFPSADDKPIVSRLGKLVEGISQTPHVWLDCQVYEEKGDLLINWDAVEGLFDPDMLDTMFMDYRALLMRLPKEETIWHENHWRDALSQRINSGAIAEANRTDVAFDESCLHQGFLAYATKKPSAPAILGETALSYADLANISANVALTLFEQALQPGARVAVVAEKGWQQVAAVLGILRAGYVYVPLDPNLPKRRLQELLTEADIQVALTTPYSDERVEWPVTVVHLPITEAMNAFTSKWRDIEIDAASPAYIIFTSGTTGKPKGVVVTHAAATNTITDINSRFAIGENDRVLALSSLSFDLSVYDIFGPLARGAAIVMPKDELSKDPAHWQTCVQKYQVTVWNSVPALVELMVNHLSANQSETLPSIRLVMMSGDWINVALPEKIHLLMPNALSVSLGGATEAAIWSIFHLIQDIDPTLTSIPYGKALANQRFYVLDTHLRHRPEGVAGELYIAGKGLAEGYLNNPAETAVRFITHPQSGERLYKTGDLGRWLPDGTIEFLGRRDNQLKINGFRIETGEIERAACKYPGVDRCVVRLYRQDSSALLLAYLCPEQDATLDDVQLHRHFAENLPEYMVPGVIMILPTLPLSANGKVDISQLPIPQLSCHSGEFIAPADDIEHRLCQLGQNILGGEALSVTQDLFKSGIDSRRLTDLVTQIRKEFTPAFPLRAAFETPNMRGIAEAVRNALDAERTNDELPPIVKAPDMSRWPLTSAQQRLWFHDQLYPGNSTYNLVEPFELNGLLNVDALSQALRIFVARHPVLTSRILDDGAEAYMSPSPETSFQLQLEQALDMPSQERERYTQRALAAAAAYPFDTRSGDMFRASLTVFSAQCHLLIIAVHHIVWDGWSTAIMAGEISEIYNALVAGKTPSDTPDRLNFLDVALWEQTHRGSRAFNIQLDYWVNQLGNNLPVLALPTTPVDSRNLTATGARHPFHLSSQLTARFDALCVKLGITPFMGYMTAWQLLLHWWCQQDDIVVGTAAGHRSHPELAGVIGFLVNSLAIRTKFQRHDAFTDLCMRVKQTCLEAYRHQDLPFDQIVNALRPKRKMSQSAPIYRSWFVLHDVATPPWALSEIKTTLLDAEFLLDVHDIKLSLVAKQGAMEGGMDYRTALFTPDIIENLALRFTQLIEKVSEDTAISLTEIKFHLDAQQPRDDEASACSNELPSWDFSVTRRK